MSSVFTICRQVYFCFQTFQVILEYSIIYEAMKICLKLAHFIYEYLKEDYKEIVLEAEERPMK